ncbi:MAG: tetratricopeptide repeat protein [Phycisphaerae bacterium]|nr:tetratricopeptide repeat protein [Phycisphaerae bacterium]
MKMLSMSQQVKKSLVLSIYFALAVSTLLVFWQVRNFDFVNYDDDMYVYENPHVLRGLTADGFISAFTSAPAGGNWLPLTWLSFMLDCHLFGALPGRLHLVNVLLHLANTLLLFAVLKKMTGSLWPSAFVAAAFALHPLHVESVAWITERKDVLSTFFWLLTMWAYTRFVNRPKITNYLLIVIFFALGLMAKPMLVTLPFVLLLLDYWPLNRLIPQTITSSGRQRRKFAPVANNLPTFYRIVIEKIPFFALSVISSVITFLAQRSGGAVAGINKLALNHRIANVFLSYAQYIEKMFWPSNLAVFYPFDTGSISFWQAAACALLLLVISVFVVRFGRNQRYLPVGWFWFVGTLIPVIGIVQVGAQAYADRYTYISYIGLFVMIAWGLPELLSKWISASSVESPHQKIVLGVLMVLALTTLGICAHRQTSCWKNSITLFSHALEVTQNNYIAHYNLGFAYSNLGRYQEAIEVYKQAIKIKPDYVEARNNLGVIYGKLDRWPEAIDAYKQAIRINPDDAVARNNLGFAYGNLGRWQDEIEACKKAIKIKPDFAEAHYNLGLAYSNLGRWQEAMDAYKQAIKIKPDYVEARNNLGVIYGKLDRYQEAIDAFKQAVRIKPDDADAHCNLGYAYLAIGDKNSALAEYNILKSLNSELANNLFKEINK